MYIKIGFTDTDIYVRLNKIQKDLHKLDDNIILNILYCSKMTGTVHQEKELHQLLTQYTTMSKYMKDNNMKQKVSGST